MAQLPKGGLVRGHDKPIHGSCAICFPGGIIRTTFSEKYNFLDIRGLTIATWIAGFGCLEIRGPGGHRVVASSRGFLRHSELREVAFPAIFWRTNWKGRRKPRLAMIFLCVYAFFSRENYISDIHPWCRNDMIIFNQHQDEVMFLNSWCLTIKTKPSFGPMPMDLARLQLLRFQVDKSLQALAQAGNWGWDSWRAANRLIPPLKLTDIAHENPPSLS